MKDSAGRRVARNTGIMAGAKGAGAVMALLGLIFAARGLTTEEFGVLVYMHAYVLFFTKVATFGSWIIVVRYAAGGLTGREVEDAEPGRFGRVIRFCVTLDLVGAVVGYLAAVVIALSLGARFEVLSAASPYLVGYTLLVLLNQKSASVGVLRLLDRYQLIALNALTIPVIRMTGCGLCWASGAPLGAYVAVWFASSALYYLFYPLLSIRELRRRNLLEPVLGGRLGLRAPMPGVWRFLLLTNTGTAITAGMVQLPVILAGVVGGAGFAAIFRIAQEVAIVLAKGAAMMDKIVFPEFTNLIAQGKGGKIPHLMMRTSGAMLAIGILIGLGIWSAGPVILATALGEDYAEAADLAVLLTIAASLSAASAPLVPALYAVGIAGRAILCRATGLVVMVGGFFAGYAALGDLGTGIAILVSATVILIMVAAIAWRHDWSGGALVADRGLLQAGKDGD